MPETSFPEPEEQMTAAAAPAPEGAAPAEPMGPLNFDFGPVDDLAPVRPDGRVPDWSDPFAFDGVLPPDPDAPLLDRKAEVAELVMDRTADLIGCSGIVGGALAVGDPQAAVPFFVRLFLDRPPELVAGSLPKEMVFDLPVSGRLALPVRAVYTGPFRG